jgi:hypothetical protein
MSEEQWIGPVVYGEACACLVTVRVNERLSICVACRRPKPPQDFSLVVGSPVGGGAVRT